MTENRSDQNFKSSYEMTYESPRLEPIRESNTRGEDGRMHGSYICPTCGNTVTKSANRYTCGACKQRLEWPGVDYTEYDAKIAEKRKAQAEKKRGDSDG